MGRTIPSFRMATVEEIKDWKEFRNRLRKSDKKLFDRMYATCHLYNSACMYAANPIRIQPYYVDYFSPLSNFARVKTESNRVRQ